MKFNQLLIPESVTNANKEAASTQVILCQFGKNFPYQFFTNHLRGTFLKEIYKQMSLSYYRLVTDFLF